MSDVADSELSKLGQEPQIGVALTRNADSAPPPMRTQKGISYQ
jgi:hypothetical protein